MDSLRNCSGKFITFEGIEGVGKSTQVSLIAEEIKQAGVDVVVTREPGGTEIAEEIRKILLEQREEKLNITAELLLLFAARAQHLAVVIKPALQEGKCVICDRFTDTTYAYQGGGRGVYLQNILQLENLVQGDLRPDLIILLNTDNIDECLIRAKSKNNGTGDRIELEEHAFFERAKKIYLARANGNPSRYKIVDVMQPIEQTHQAVLKALNEKFATT